MNDIPGNIISPPVRTRNSSALKWVLLAVGICILCTGIVIFLFSYMKANIAEFYYLPSSSMEPTLMRNDRILVNKAAFNSADPQRGDIIIYQSPPEARSDEKMFAGRVIAVPGDEIRITGGYAMIDDQRYGHQEIKQLLGLDFAEGRAKFQDGKLFADGKQISPEKLADAAGSPKAKVKIVSGMVYLNGTRLDEPYTAEDPDTNYPGDERLQIPLGCIIKEKDGNAVVRIPQGKLLTMGDNRNNANDSRYWGLLDRDRVRGKVVRIVWPEKRAREIE